ncbi:MAG TPA: bifunctional riboflavin kinase/FAD synthetase [Bacteroidota bacterium]|nr:bifunctional riboflavin kinase/FAD synthetase [Bacteroidota bacterium]
MRVYRSIDEVPYDSSTVISVGTFDGVHRAHRAILKKLVERSKSANKRNLVITFEPHPRSIVSHDAMNVKYLTTLDERMYLFQSLGIDNLLVITFDKEFSQLSFRDFYSQCIVQKIGVSEVVEGFNHHFGKDRQGTITILDELGKEFGFVVTHVEPITYNGKPISSSRIREALEDGAIDIANEMLGYPYLLTGTVIEGDKRGTTLGYPTANVELPSSKLIPKFGIYVASVKIEGTEYFGMASIGRRPTFYKDGNVIVEVHVFDFYGTLYGKELSFSLLKRLRDQQKFDTVDQLIRQMEQDKEQSKSLIQSLRVV